MSVSSFETGEGSVSADRDPSSAFAFREGTFSHKGRREEFATVEYLPHPPFQHAVLGRDDVAD